MLVQSMVSMEWHSPVFDWFGIFICHYIIKNGFWDSSLFFQTPLKPVTCESLVSREFSRILLTFHFSISISRHFHFTFHSRSRSQGIFISLFILEMSERKTKFTFQFSKRVKSFQISLFFSRKKSEIVHVTLHFVMKKLHFW